MSLISQYQPCVRMGHMELDGLINMIGRKLEDKELDSIDAAHYIGALAALHIIRFSYYVEYPDQFIKLMDKYINGEF